MPYTKHNYQKGDELLASQLNDMDDQIALNEQTADTLVTVSNTQPLEEKNRVWVKATPSEIEIPTMEDVDELNRHLSDKQDAPATAGTAGQVLGLDDQLQPVWTDGGSSEDAAPIIINTASGAIASFADGADNRQIRKIVGTIEPVQEGTGDPSPDNVRPISGWPQANIYQSRETLYDPARTGQGYINAAGVVKTSAASIYTYLTSIVPGDTIYINMDNYDTGTERIIAFYSEASVDSFISYVSYTEVPFTFVVPTNAAYMRATLRAESTNKIICNNALPINWETEAGTVYGGTVTLNEDGSADVVANRAKIILDGTESWSEASGAFYYDRLDVLNYRLLSQNDWICNKYLVSGAIGNSSEVPSKSDKTIFNQNSGSGYINLRRVWVKDETYTTLAEFTQSLSSAPIEIVLTLPESTTYHFDSIGQLKTFLGQNNVWCDTGDITELTYPVDTTAAIDAGDAENASAISTLSGSLATVETTSTASKAYAVDDLLVYNNQLYKVASAIAAGGTLTPGTNIVATTVEAEISNGDGGQTNGVLTTFQAWANKYLKTGEYTANGRRVVFDKNHLVIEHDADSSSAIGVSLLSGQGYSRLPSSDTQFYAFPATEYLSLDALSQSRAYIMQNFIDYETGSGVNAVFIQFATVVDNVVTVLASKGWGAIPEFVYSIRGGTLVAPDNATHFGIFYISRRQAANYLKEVTFTIEPIYANPLNALNS